MASPKPKSGAGGGPEVNENELASFLENVSPENRLEALGVKKYSLPAVPERHYELAQVPKNLPISKPPFAPSPEVEGSLEIFLRQTLMAIYIEKKKPSAANPFTIYNAEQAILSVCCKPWATEPNPYYLQPQFTTYILTAVENQRKECKEPQDSQRKQILDRLLEELRALYEKRRQEALARLAKKGGGGRRRQTKRHKKQKRRGTKRCR